MNELTMPVSRESILTLEDAMKSHPGNFDANVLPVIHHFAPGVYVREFHLPAGIAVTGKIHKHQHVAMLIKGKAALSSEFDAPQIMEAPYIWISQPGVKRVVMGIEDAIFVTVHPTELTDLEQIENEVIAKSYEEFDRFKLGQDKTEKLGEYVL